MDMMPSFKNYLAVFQTAVENSDNITAVRNAKNIIKLAEEQCALPNVPQPYKDYYIANATRVREWLAGIEQGRVATSSADISDSDKISETDWFSDDVPNLTMRDVAGLENVKDAFKINIFAPLSQKYSHIYKKYRKDMGLQVLLYGPPGTGKTHIVKCLAGQLGCKIAVVKVKDVMANLVGDGAKIIASVFEQANQYDKCIIFFDEIDAIAASRDDEESRHTKEQLTTLLTYMDGFTSGTKPGQIRIIVAATNRPWILDSAVKRGGRFDTQIYVPLPDEGARAKLIALALGKDKSVQDRLDIPCASDVTLEWLVDKFEGFAGADIKAVCKQIINKPLYREIICLSKTGEERSDQITRADCEEVLKSYINSITDEMLFQFDAYSANASYEEYMRTLKTRLEKKLANDDELQAHEERWLADSKSVPESSGDMDFQKFLMLLAKYMHKN